MARLILYLLGGYIAEAARSPAGLLSRSSAPVNQPPLAHGAWQQKFEVTLDHALTRNLQALDHLLRHSTSIGAHFIDFQKVALAMSRKEKELEHVSVSNTNRLNAPAFNNALVTSKQELDKMQADMSTFFKKMEQQYQAVTDRTKQTEALMHQVMQKKQVADQSHQQVQDEHADMIRRMQMEQAEFDAQMRRLQAAMPRNSTATAPPPSPATPPPPPPATPPPPVTTPAPPAPSAGKDKYEVMIDGLEKQQEALESQMQDLDSLLGDSTTAFMAAVNATSTLKAETATTII